jgi:hypothetical protein
MTSRLTLITLVFVAPFAICTVALSAARVLLVIIGLGFVLVGGLSLLGLVHWKAGIQ